MKGRVTDDYLQTNRFFEEIKTRKRVLLNPYLLTVKVVIDNCNKNAKLNFLVSKNILPPFTVNLAFRTDIDQQFYDELNKKYVKYLFILFIFNFLGIFYLLG